jgi:hypothetical protein
MTPYRLHAHGAFAACFGETQEIDFHERQPTTSASYECHYLAPFLLDVQGRMLCSVVRAQRTKP